jgi:hypothetical protein
VQELLLEHRRELDALLDAASQHHKSVRRAHGIRFLHKRALSRDLHHVRGLYAASMGFLFDGYHDTAELQQVIGPADKTQAI